MRTSLLLIALPLVYCIPYDILALQDTFPSVVTEPVVNNVSMSSVGEDPSLLDGSIFLAKTGFDYLKSKIGAIKLDSLMEDAANQRRSRRKNKRAIRKCPTSASTAVPTPQQLLVPNPKNLKNPKFSTQFSITPTITSIVSTIITTPAIKTTSSFLPISTTSISSSTSIISPVQSTQVQTQLASTSKPLSTLLPTPTTSALTVKPSLAPNTGTNLGFTSSGFNLDVLHVGQGTFFETGLGSCGVTNVASDSIVAVSKLLFDTFPGAGPNPNLNPICGKRLRVTYGGKSFIVTVQDRCEA